MNKSKKETSSIAYKGNVTIKILHGKKVVKEKKIHNAGTDLLFNFLIKCLGNNYYEQLAPRFIRCFHCDSEVTDVNIGTQLVIENAMSDPIAFGSINYPENKSIEFTFLIPASQINNSGSQSVNVLALYSLDTYADASIGSPLAYINLGSDEISISSGVNLVIIWQMSVSNVTVE